MKASIKKTFSVLGVLLVGGLVFQNCSAVKFDEASSQEGDPKVVGKSADTCTPDDFTAFIDERQPNGGKAYSMLQMGGNTMDSESHTLQYWGAPSPDGFAKDAVYFLSIDNVRQASSGILNKSFLVAGVEVGQAEITYCQAKKICQELFASRNDWRSFNCTLTQYEFDSRGYYSYAGAPAPNNDHLKELNQIAFFKTNQFGDAEDLVQQGVHWNGIKYTNKAVATATTAQFEEMKQSRVLIFKH